MNTVQLENLKTGDTIQDNLTGELCIFLKKYKRLIPFRYSRTDVIVRFKGIKTDSTGCKPTWNIDGIHFLENYNVVQSGTQMILNLYD